VKISEPGAGVVVFADEDITSPGEWLCTKNDLVVDTARALTTIEEELFKFSSIFTRVP
jgi:hypothetical protein